MKITLHKVLVRQVALYTCGAWATTRQDKNKLAIFELIVLRRIFGPKRNTQGEFELRTCREIEEIYNETNIIGILKRFIEKILILIFISYFVLIKV